MRLIILLFFVLLFNSCFANEYYGTLKNSSSNALHNNQPNINTDFNPSTNDQNSFRFETFARGYKDNKPNNTIDPNDYVLTEVHGKKQLIQKALIPDYTPQFNIKMITTAHIAFLCQRACNPGYKNNPQFFAKQFNNMFPEKVFHYFAHYVHKGFREYVKKLPGFEDFITSIKIQQLQPGSDICKSLEHTDEWPKILNNLKTMRQNVLHEREQRQQATHKEQILKTLHQLEFNESAVELLNHYGWTECFSYNTNELQHAQLKNIAHHFDETALLWKVNQNNTHINDFLDQSALFGIMANNANREKHIELSQELLNIGANFLAFGKGVLVSGIHNITSFYQFLSDPEQTVQQLATVATNIGIGIAKLMMFDADLQTALEYGDAKRIADLNKQAYHCIGLVQQAIEQWNNETPASQKYEAAGGLITDAVFMVFGGKVIPALQQTKYIQSLAQYKPVALAKLGAIGQEINQIVGLTCARGAKAVQTGLETILSHPKLLQGQKLLTESILLGNEYLRASNNYLKKIARQQIQSILDPEHCIMRLGQIIKNIPNECIAKTKQFLDDHAVVIDTYGNKLVSKIGNDDWLVNLSEKGKKCLYLLHDAVAQGTQTITAPQYRVVPLSGEVKQILKSNYYTFKGALRTQYADTTFGEFYGHKICEFLKGRGAWLDHCIKEFKGIDHLLMPAITQRIQNGKLKEKIVGFHLDTERKLEQAGMYVLKNCKELVGGMYEADLHFGGIFKEGKTFFPSDWDQAKLLSKISEACHNAHDILTKSGGVTIIQGKVKESFTIVVKLNKRGKIVTVYPIVEGKL